MLEIVQQHFRPEFINRIDDIVVFHPLGTEQIRRIVEIQIGVPAHAAWPSATSARARRRRRSTCWARPASTRCTARGRSSARSSSSSRTRWRSASWRANSAPGDDRVKGRRFEGRRAGYAKIGGEGIAMPFYEYQCAACGRHHEELQKITDRPLRKCPACGKNDAEAPRLGAGVPPEGRRLVRDRLQGRQGRAAQHRRATRNRRAGEAPAADKAKEAKPDAKADAKPRRKAETEARRAGGARPAARSRIAVHGSETRTPTSRARQAPAPRAPRHAR